VMAEFAGFTERSPVSDVGTVVAAVRRCGGIHAGAFFDVARSPMAKGAPLQSAMQWW